jgi:hypothetical protein
MAGWTVKPHAPAAPKAEHLRRHHEVLRVLFDQ